MSSFCICKSYIHLFSKNTCEIDIVLTRTVKLKLKLKFSDESRNGWGICSSDRYLIHLYCPAVQANFYSDAAECRTLSSGLGSIPVAALEFFRLLQIQIHILSEKECQSRSVIWIYTVCKGRSYLGSAGPGLTENVLMRLCGCTGRLDHRSR